MGNAFPFVGFESNVPSTHTVSKYDSLEGFPNGRVAKEMKVSEQELYSAKVPLKDRDYCSHLLLDFYKCRRQEFPFVSNCHHQKHAYLNCQYDEYVDRMKEFEREKRLMQREQRAAAA